MHNSSPTTLYFCSRDVSQPHVPLVDRQRPQSAIVTRTDYGRTTRKPDNTPHNTARGKIILGRPMSSKPDISRNQENNRAPKHSRNNDNSNRNYKSILLRYRSRKSQYNLGEDDLMSNLRIRSTTPENSTRNEQAEKAKRPATAASTGKLSANGNDPNAPDNRRRTNGGFLLDPGQYRDKSNPFMRYKGRMVNGRPLSSMCGRVSWRLQPPPKEEFSVCLTGSGLQLQNRGIPS